MARPSDPLLKLIRDLAQTNGLNTAALAKKVGLERGRLKKVLAGQEPMTVDELILLSDGLELDAQALARLGGTPLQQPEGGHLQDPAAETVEPVASTQSLDPFGNHAEQLLQMAFELGCDIFCLLDSAKIQDSGIPASVRSRYPDNLPLRLEAAYHHHNQPRFKPNGLELNLSFDSLYTCVLPWSCFQQITLFPLPWDPLEETPGDEAPEPQKGTPHLRLLD